MPHVGETLGYRVTPRRRRASPTSATTSSRSAALHIDERVWAAVPGVDLLIHDAQYTPAEFKRKRDWGHCTIEYAVWLAGEVGARRLALYHHDPEPRRRHDRPPDAPPHAAARIGVEVFAAHEGLTVESRHVLDALALRIVDVVGVVARIVLGLVFVVAGTTKVAAGRAWLAQAVALGAPRPLVPAVPWIEIGLGAMLLVGVAAPWPAAAAALLLAAIHRAPGPPPRRRRAPSVRLLRRLVGAPLGGAHLIRNAALLLLAVIALWG